MAADHNGNVFVADLEAAAAYVQFSSDHGTSFGPVGNQCCPSDDREWLTPVGDVLYMTYHEFTSNAPLIWKSTDHGTSFTPGGSILGANATAQADAASTTLVSKPVTDQFGNLYVLVNTSTAAENAAAQPSNGPLDRLYLARSTDGGLTFTATLIDDQSNGANHPGTSGTWGHVFNQLAIDAGGNLYVAVAGTLNGAPAATAGPNSNIYLLRGANHGSGVVDGTAAAAVHHGPQPGLPRDRGRAERPGRGRLLRHPDRRRLRHRPATTTTATTATSSSSSSQPGTSDALDARARF